MKNPPFLLRQFVFSIQLKLLESILSGQALLLFIAPSWDIAYPFESFRQHPENLNYILFKFSAKGMPTLNNYTNFECNFLNIKELRFYGFLEIRINNGQKMEYISIKEVIFSCVRLILKMSFV